MFNQQFINVIPRILEKRVQAKSLSPQATYVRVVCGNKEVLLHNNPHSFKILNFGKRSFICIALRNPS